METEKKEKKEMRAAYPYLGSCVGCPLGQKIKIKRSEQATSAFPSAASAARFLALSLAMHTTHIYDSEPRVFSPPGLYSVYLCVVCCKWIPDGLMNSGGVREERILRYGAGRQTD